MKRQIYIFVSIMITFLFLVSGCRNRGESIEEASTAPEVPDKLVVYMNATPHTFLMDKSGDNESNITLYPSKHVIGTMLVGGEIDCPNGNIFEKALKEYEAEKEIQIEVHYLEEFSDTEDILQQLWVKGEKLPDVLLLNKQPHYDYYRLAEQELLVDFSSYMQEDDNIEDANCYYQNVLSGGKIMDKQYGLPILFNMNGMITTSSFLSMLGRQIPDENISYEELLEILKEGCIALENDQSMEAIFESSGYRAIGHYIPSILTGAAYPQYFDDAVQNILVSESTITSIFELMQYFNKQEFARISDWEKQPYIANMYNNQSKSIQMELTPDLYERFGIFLSGGRSGGVGFYNSLLTDVAFFESIYQENGEDMVFCGIPTLESADSYAANISMVAFGLQTTKYPEEVYHLIRYLMDYEYPMEYGFSINKQLTEKQLENIQSTSTAIYPESIWEGVNFGKALDELEDEIVYIQPMSDKNRTSIEYMLNHIAGAGLPYGILEYDLYTSMLNMVGDNKMTPTEASRWIMDNWNLYLSSMGKMEPFYDAEYNRSIQLIGDLPGEAAENE